MRPELIHILILVLCCASVCAAQLRPTIKLDGQWRLNVPDKQTYDITVPGSWQSQIPDLKEYAGRASYSREVTVPESWRGKRVFVHFGAADYFAEVSVNSEKVGSHEGGYTPFVFEIQDHLRFGQSNDIKVDVIDVGPGESIDGFVFEEIPHGKQSWYGNCSGLWQSVYIEARSTAYVHRIVVDPDIDRSVAHIKLELAGEAKGSVRLAVDAPSGAGHVAPVTLEVGKGELECEVSIPTPALWSPDSPSLYTVRAELVAPDGQVADILTSHFGMRKIEAKDGKILLNNKPIFIAAALDQDFYPITEYAVPSDDYLKDQFLKAKHLGLNMLRCHIKVPDPRYLEWADKLGLMVWYEIPNWANLTTDSKRRGRETLDAMLRRDHNHPSLVIVSIINEAWGVNVHDADHRKWMADTYEHAKSIEPGRLIVDNSACGSNFHVKTDIEDFHTYYQIPDQAPEYCKWIEDFSKHPDWTFAPGSEGQRRGFEPLMLSEFGNWGLPRLSNLHRTYHKDPWWFGTARSLAKSNTYPFGVQERFSEFHLDRVFGTIDKLSDAFQDQEWLSLKFQIEELRRYPSIVGYVITEFTDLHWESNGLLDYCRNPKSFHDLMHTVQDQDIVFAQSDRANCVSGDQCAFRVYVSHFSSLDLTSCKVKYACEKAALRGEIPVGAIAQGDAREIGEIKLTAPDEARPTRMRLTISLVDSGGKALASNYDDITVFPAEQPDMATDVLIASGLDKETARRVREGAHAVICIESADQVPLPLSGLEITGRYVAGRWGSWCNCVTWFKESPAFAGAPVPKTMDSSFESIIPNCAIDGIDASRWDDDVLSGIFVGWVQSHAGIVVQLRCGKGKAILTTLPLVSGSKKDPMARFLLASLARYVASDRCQPKLENSLETIDLDHTFLATAEEKGATWRYTTDQPSAGWEKLDFDDSKWSEGKSGFGTPETPNSHVGTRWDTGDIWLRYSGDLPETVSEAVVRLYHDEDVEVYINGTRIIEFTGFFPSYQNHVLGTDAKAALVRGRNVIAVHCHQTVGGQFVDLGLQYSTKEH